MFFLLFRDDCLSGQKERQPIGQPCEIGVLGPDAACRLWLLRPSKRAATLQGIGVRVSSLPGCEEGPLSTPVDPEFLAFVKTIDFANIKIASCTQPFSDFVFERFRHVFCSAYRLQDLPHVKSTGTLYSTLVRALNKARKRSRAGRSDL